MKKHLSIFTLGLLAASSPVTAPAAAEVSNTPPAVASAEDPKYTAAIEGRTADILKVLELKDSAKSAAVHDLIITQYRTLFAWHNANDPKLKALKKQANGKDTNEIAHAKTEIDQVQASLKTVHDAFIANLSAQLTAAQVEQVKDKMTYGKVQFTFKGYLIEYPDMNDDQKAKVLEFLKEARELAMDGGSSEEKSDIFNKYKGRINNYLSKQGITSKTSKERQEKQQKAKTTEQPAETEKKPESPDKQ